VERRPVKGPQVKNQRRSEQSSETYAGWAALEESGSRWRAFLVRDSDGMEFVIADELSEREANDLATTAARAPDPVLEAGLLATAWALDRRFRLFRAFPALAALTWHALPGVGWSAPPVRVVR
jgi:hypothetical protein